MARLPVSQSQRRILAGLMGGEPKIGSNPQDHQVGIGFPQPAHGRVVARFAQFKNLVTRHQSFVKSGNLTHTDGWSSLAFNYSCEASFNGSRGAKGVEHEM